VERVEREELQRDLERLADGDRGAFHPVFVRLWPLLRGFAARCLPWGEAEDAAQETLIRIFTRAAEFDRGRDALTWVLGIAANEIRTALKRRRRRREHPDEALAGRPDGGRSPEESAAAAERELALGVALATLRPADAETLLAYARGERPDLPGPTFRKRVERALVRLRTAWRLNHDRR
jgi:RNA polymerase sigma-70 factor (ECF subfamily)